MFTKYLPDEIKEIIFRKLYKMCISDAIVKAHIIIHNRRLNITLSDLLIFAKYRTNFMYNFDNDIAVKCISCDCNTKYDDCIKCQICCNVVCIFCATECSNIYCYANFCMHCIDHNECYECDQREIYHMNRNRYSGDSGTDSDSDDYNDSNIIETDNSVETDETDDSDDDTDL